MYALSSNIFTSLCDSPRAWRASTLDTWRSEKHSNHTGNCRHRFICGNMAESSFLEPCKWFLYFLETYQKLFDCVHVGAWSLIRPFLRAQAALQNCLGWGDTAVLVKTVFWLLFIVGRAHRARWHMSCMSSRACFECVCLIIFKKNLSEFSRCLKLEIFQKKSLWERKLHRLWDALTYRADCLVPSCCQHIQTRSLCFCANVELSLYYSSIHEVGLVNLSEPDTGPELTGVQNRHYGSYITWFLSRTEASEVTKVTNSRMNVQCRTTLHCCSRSDLKRLHKSKTVPAPQANTCQLPKLAIAVAAATHTES